MNDKYIIKNCPCLFNSYYASGKTVRFECNDGNHDDKLCCDVTDCLLKQIVSRLNNFTDDYGLEAGFYAGELLSMLDIQEVE